MGEAKTDKVTIFVSKMFLNIYLFVEMFCKSYYTFNNAVGIDLEQQRSCVCYYLDLDSNVDFDVVWVLIKQHFLLT